MRRTLGLLSVVLLLSCLAAGTVFGGSQPEATKTDAATEVSQAATGGLINYATLSDYQKATGKNISKFNEAPMLAEMVKAGKIPPVEDRISDEPMVISPLEGIGKYGGVMRAPALGPTGSSGDSQMTRQQNLFLYESDFVTTVPNVAKGWEFSDDLKSITIFLRKGMKWSDGAPLTTSDVRFAYEDIMLNTDIMPKPPGNLSPGGEFMKLSVIDDYTFRLDFAVPFPPVLPILALTRTPFLLYPRHYLEQFHIKYNPKADEEAKKAGFDNWYNWFGAKRATGPTQMEPGLPLLTTWVLDREDSTGNRYYTRNPYYWKIDTAGNQLPYIDESVRVLVENREVRTLKIVSGEFDFAGWDLPLKEFTLYKENEAKAGYRVMVWPQAVNGRTTYDFNYGDPDPVLREVFEDIRFRQAMSVAIDRNEIIKTLAYGKAQPMQAAALPNTSFFVEWTRDYYAQYDPDMANKLLDEMGLKWDAAKKVRLRPDGKPLQVTIEAIHQVFIDYSELVREYWEAVGVQVAVKKLERNLGIARRAAGEIQVGVYYLGESMEPLMFQNPGAFKILQKWASNQIGGQWEDWLESDGAEGVEPPQDVKQLYDVANRWQQTVPGSNEYLALGKEMLEIHAKSMRSIGIIGMPPIPIVFKADMKNTPQDGMWQGGPFMFLPYQAEQWYWDN